VPRQVSARSGIDRSIKLLYAEKAINITLDKALGMDRILGNTRFYWHMVWDSGSMN